MKQPETKDREQNRFKFETARWSIFGLFILAYVLVYFHRMAPGMLRDELMAAFGITGAALGSLAATYFMVYAAMQIPSGVVADKLGTRLSMVAGNAMAGLGSIIFGLAPTFALAWCGRLMVGLGVSVIFVSIMKSNAEWFSPRHYGFMSGLTLLLGNLGSILAAGPLAAILDHMTFRTVFVGLGGLAVGLAVAGFFIVRSRPQDLGFEPVALPAGSGGSAGNTDPDGETDDIAGEPAGGWIRELGRVIAQRSLWPGFIVQFGMIGSLYAFMGLWATPFLMDVAGMERHLAAKHLTAMLAAFAVGSLVFGWISDRLGRRRPILLAGLSAHCLAWAVWIRMGIPAGVWPMILLCVLGFSGASFVITFAAAKEMSLPGLAGMSVSVVNTGAFAGTSLLQPLLGWVLDKSWSGTMVDGVRVYGADGYLSGFKLMLGLGLVALTASWFMPETFCRNQRQENPVL